MLEFVQKPHQQSLKNHQQSNQNGPKSFQNPSKIDQKRSQIDENASLERFQRQIATRSAPRCSGYFGVIGFWSLFG